MINKFFQGALCTNTYWQITKILLMVFNAVAIFIYGFLHLIFFDFPFQTEDELLIVAKIVSSASCFAIGISLLIIISDFIEMMVNNKKKHVMLKFIKPLIPVILLITVLLCSCKGPVVSSGTIKDFNTGTLSSYTGIEPLKVFLVMNGEELTHTDIPFGESFLLVNDGINGMVVNQGKVKIGCSLLIKDQQGKILLHEQDLFSGRDEFEEKDAKMLKCTVNTGEPMKWEEKYTVAVSFWDKNGIGKIDNTVTIRCIDMP